MLSTLSRRLTYLNAALYAVLGLALSLFSVQLAPVFAWKVTPFMTATIGAWCLGNAWHSYITARRWSWSLVYLSLFYLWMFGIFETAVLIKFNSKLSLTHPIAWLYVATLALTVITALVGIADWFRLRPRVERVGGQTTSLQYALTIAFVIFVGFLALYGLAAPAGAPGTNGGIFPEIMSPFTLRSFGAFYLCIALAVVPSIFTRGLQAILHHSIAQYGLIVFVTLAAFVHISLFDFSAHPGGALYFIAYLIVAIPLLFIFRTLGTGKV